MKVRVVQRYNDLVEGEIKEPGKKGETFEVDEDRANVERFSPKWCIVQHFRKHWFAAYMQRNGIDVIPTISWSTPDSFEWCFDGEPKGSVVAVSSVGVMNSRERTELFMLGYNEMIKRLMPETILFYGAVPQGCTGNIIRLSAFSETMRKGIEDGRQRSK